MGKLWKGRPREIHGQTVERKIKGNPHKLQFVQWGNERTPPPIVKWFKGSQPRSPIGATPLQVLEIVLGLIPRQR